MRLHPLDLRFVRALSLPILLTVVAVFATACESQGLVGDAAPMPLLENDLPACEAALATYFDRGAIQPPGQATGYEADQERDIGAAFAQAFAMGVEGDLDGMVEALAATEIEHPDSPGTRVPAYTVCQDIALGAVLFRPPMGSGLPVMAWRTGEARRVIVEAPHPWFERFTLEQGVEAFVEHGARALIVSGVHRCASHQEVACSGRTSVCGDPDGAYRESDPAHNPESVFHAMHVALSEAYRRHYAISLHGVSHQRVIVSDGTELHAAAEGPIGAAALDLHDMLQGEAEVESCNGVREMGQSDRYCGTTNAQGRHLNDSADVCLDSAEHTSHRFMHLEQPLHVRATEGLRHAVIERVFDRLDPLGAR